MRLQGKDIYVRNQTASRITDLCFLYFLDDEDTKFIFHKELDAEHQNQPLYVYITIQDGRRCVRRDPHGKELYQE